MGQEAWKWSLAPHVQHPSDLSTGVILGCAGLYVCLTGMVCCGTGGCIALIMIGWPADGGGGVVSWGGMGFLNRLGGGLYGLLFR